MPTRNPAYIIDYYVKPAEAGEFGRVVHLKFDFSIGRFPMLYNLCYV